MFEDIFAKVYDKNKEIKVLGVWGKDGLVLEKKYFSQADDVDLDFTGAELADVLAKIDKTKIAPNKYFLNLNFGEYYLLIYSLTPEFFLVILADDTIITGKLSFYLDLYREKLVYSL